MFEVIDRISGSSCGKYETIDEARGCVAYDNLSDWEIWENDHIVDEGCYTEPMTTARVREIVAEIDQLNGKVMDLVRSIREGGHADRLAIVEALEDEPCVVLACARDVLDGLILDQV